MDSITAMSQDSSNFHVEEERVNDNLNNRPPQFIIDLGKNENRQELTDDELAEAKMVLWNNKFLDLKFPRERKFRVDPLIGGQSHGIISFIPSKTARPDKDGCFGVLKLRGNFANQHDAERYGAMLMRKYDSFAEYDIVRVGQEFPLMVDNSIYTSETREINIKAIVDDISLSYIRRKKEQEREERREVEERARRLINANTEEEKEETAADDLEFYTMLRTKKAHCQHVIDETKKKGVEAQEALTKILKEIAVLDEKYPTYKKDFIAQYDRALKTIGTDPGKNPLIQYMKKDVESAAAETKSAPVNHALATADGVVAAVNDAVVATSAPAATFVASDVEEEKKE